MLSKLIEDRLIRVDEKNYDPDRATDPRYDGVPRIKTESIASLVNRILVWWWDDRKSIREKKIERQLLALRSEIGSLTKEYQKLQSILCIRENHSAPLSIELAEEEEIRILG